MEDNMAIDWTRFTGMRERTAIDATLAELITADNYGNGDGQWSLTELINERSAHAIGARRLIEGVGDDGQKTDAGPIRAANGLELAIRLRVLSRQACFEDKDGHGINTWDPTELDAENYNNEYCPKDHEGPDEGDMVWVKGNALRTDPVTKQPLIKKYRMALKARMEAKIGRTVKAQMATHHHDKFKVGADGCINVPYLIAVQLLTTKGRGLVLPRFSSGTAKSKDAKIRQITNWLFEEAHEQPKDKPREKKTAAVD
jgi:hypothetical protein